MIADEPVPEEEKFTALFAAAEEALASERPATAPCPAGIPSELDARLHRDLACVHLLRRALRRPLSAGTGPAPDSTGTDERRAVPSAKRVELALASGASPELADELRTLLCKRLQIVSLLFAGAYGFFAGLSLVKSARGITTVDYWFYYGPVWLVAVVSAVFAAVFWRRPLLSLGRLRAMEIGSLGLALTAMTWIFFWDLFVFDILAYLRRLAGTDGEYRHLLDFFACAYSLPYVLGIVGYAALIPCTWRRCAVVVGVTALTPVTLGVVAGLSAVTPSTVLLYLVLPMTVFFSVAVAIAVYGTHRIEILRREALESRKLGQYRLKRRLGAGGMGEVYLAEHVLLKQPCAVKLIRPERAGDTAILRRFEREVQATARLKHWNTVQIFDYGHAADGTFYYVMEYLPGPTLEQLVQRHGPLAPGRAVHLLRQACMALREAHALGLIHRDLKPANMMVCERGAVHDVLKLLDFGLVKAVGLDSRDEALTQQGAIAGTPAYMSPEQASGNEHLDARADVYSLGAVAYFLLTGQPPFRRDKAIQLILAQIHEPVRPLAELRPDVPADLQDVVLRCLEKDPARRFPDVTRLHEALAACACAGQWTEERAAQGQQAQEEQGHAGAGGADPLMPAVTRPG
jgi:serine/threonine-protein kinase